MLRRPRQTAALVLRTFATLPLPKHLMLRLAQRSAASLADVVWARPLDPMQDRHAPRPASAPPQPAMSASPAGPAVRDIFASALREELDAGRQLLLVDVREPMETARGIIAGARLIPVGEVLAHVGELRDARRPIVLYCASGRRSAHAAQHLADRGVSDVTNLVGGVQAWASAGGPLVPPPVG